MAEVYKYTHKRHELLGDSCTIAPKRKELHEFDVQHSGARVTVDVAAASNSAAPEFEVTVLDKNLRRVARVKREGRLATGEIYLEKEGRYFLRIMNKGYNLAIHVSFRVWVETRREPGDDEGALLREPIDTRSLRRGGRQLGGEVRRCEAPGCRAVKRPDVLLEGETGAPVKK
jgi:hypothetical protein